MLIKRIDFKGDRIWRVYRNGEIIWSTSDLKYLESVKTGLQFIDIGALGISSSSLVYNLENKINFKEFYNFNSDEARNITNKHKIIITDSYNLASSNSKIREIYKSLLFSGMKRFNSNDSKLNFILKKIEINTLQYLNSNYTEKIIIEQFLQIIGQQELNSVKAVHPIIEKRVLSFLINPLYVSWSARQEIYIQLQQKIFSELNSSPGIKGYFDVLIKTSVQSPLQVDDGIKIKSDNQIYLIFGKDFILRTSKSIIGKNSINIKTLPKDYLSISQSSLLIQNLQIDSVLLAILNNSKSKIKLTKQQIKTSCFSHFNNSDSVTQKDIDTINSIKVVYYNNDLSKKLANFSEIVNFGTCALNSSKTVAELFKIIINENNFLFFVNDSGKKLYQYNQIIQRQHNSISIDNIQNIKTFSLIKNIFVLIYQNSNSKKLTFKFLNKIEYQPLTHMSSSSKIYIKDSIKELNKNNLYSANSTVINSSMILNNFNIRNYSKLEENFVTNFKINLKILKDFKEAVVLQLSEGLINLKGVSMFSDYASSILAIAVFDRNYYKSFFSIKDQGTIFFINDILLFGEQKTIIENSSWLSHTNLSDLSVSGLFEYQISSQIFLTKMFNLSKAWTVLCEKNRAALQKTIFHYLQEVFSNFIMNYSLASLALTTLLQHGAKVDQQFLVSSVLTFEEKWIYPVPMELEGENEKEKNYFIEQVFSFSYATGEIN